MDVTCECSHDGCDEHHITMTKITNHGMSLMGFWFHIFSKILTDVTDVPDVPDVMVAQSAHEWWLTFQVYGDIHGQFLDLMRLFARPAMWPGGHVAMSGAFRVQRVVEKWLVLSSYRVLARYKAPSDGENGDIVVTSIFPKSFQCQTYHNISYFRYHTPITG